MSSISESGIKLSIERGGRLPPKSANGPCGLFNRIIRDYYLFQILVGVSAQLDNVSHFTA